MLGDAYFQLRAQVGTGLYSLLRLAAESGAREETQAALREAQNRLRETFTFVCLGPEGGGKSALLNTLLGRELCGPAAEPSTAGRVAVFRYGDMPQDSILPGGAIECRRPHTFLRDFTVIEAPGDVSTDTVGSFLFRADVILFVLSAAGGSAEIWEFLPRLGRELLKRLVFVVWQSDRISTEDGASTVKRLRQAMLRNLAQACPIFTGSKSDSAGREKLERWIESEIIFSDVRRARLREIGEVAKEAMREIVTKPRATRQELDREIDRVRERLAQVDDCQEQSHRQVAGAIWTLAQNFDGLRRGGEYLLGTYVRVLDLLWKRSTNSEEFAGEIEPQVRESFAVQLHDQLLALESDLRDAAEEQLRGEGAIPSEGAAVKVPPFPCAKLEETLVALDTPLDSAKVVDVACAEARRACRLPAIAALGALAIAAGAALAGHPSAILSTFALGIVLFVILLAVLLRRNLIAQFGRHFTANRAALLQALEPALRSAAEQFYGGFAPAMRERAAELEAQRHRSEPLLAQLRQIEGTFSRLEGDLRAGLARTGGPE